MLYPFPGGLIVTDALQLTEQWNDILASSPDQSAVVNVSKWLSRATMDCLGEGQ